jgi:hypothetical protein
LADEEPRAAVETAWHVLKVVQESVARLEDGATRVAAAQVAGFVALWTQLWTFENGPPRVLAWCAWALVFVSIAFLSPVITPRRLGRFWGTILPSAGAAAAGNVSPAQEFDVVRGLIDELDRQYRRMYRALRVSIVFSLGGVAIAALAYIIEKGFYAP